MPTHAFLVVSRRQKWRVVGDGKDQAPTFEKSGEAEALVAEEAKEFEDVLAKRQTNFERLRSEQKEARTAFVNETRIETVRVKNPRRLMGDFRKPTIFFPDGTEDQFEPGATDQVMRKKINSVANERFPEPEPEEHDQPDRPGVVKEISVWAVELIADDRREEFADIESWTNYFPMQRVSAHLDQLAAKGWSLKHVSEDRGLFRNEIANNLSLPVSVRYLLVDASTPNRAS